MTGSVMYDRGITPCVNQGMDKYAGPGLMLQTKTMIGEDFVGPGLSAQLETFYQKAKPADKAKCLELLTAINIQKEVEPPRGFRGRKAPSRSPQLRAQTPGPNSFRDYTPQPPRPKTAMAVSTKVPDNMKMLYQTTYKREFIAPETSPVTVDRPRSTKMKYATAYNLSGPIGDTTYDENFCQPDHSKAKPKEQDHEFTRNNPHPNQKFMVWRFPRHTQAQLSSKFPEGLTFEAMEKICRGKCRSTYNDDFSGMPQGFDFGAAASLPEDWKSKVPYSLNSSMRYSYQMPGQARALQPNVTRYGANKTKGVTAVGAVPAVSQPHLHLKPRTTYDREYVDPVGVPGDVMDIRDVSKRLGADTLQKQMDLANKDERETLNAMLKSMKSPTPPCGKRPASRTKAPPTYKTEQFEPTWLSTWTGPM